MIYLIYKKTRINKLSIKYTLVYFGLSASPMKIKGLKKKVIRQALALVPGKRPGKAPTP